MVKNLPASVGDENPNDPGFDPWVGKIPWRRTWQPTPVSLSGEFHGQKSLGGYNPQGSTECNMTEATSHARTHDTLTHLSEGLNLKCWQSQMCQECEANGTLMHVSESLGKSEIYKKCSYILIHIYPVTQ